MKKVILIFVAFVFSSFSLLAHATNNHSVRGYTKKNGTYVAPHRQTNPDHTQRDNWSSKDNANPYTGKAGKKNPRK